MTSAKPQETLRALARAGLGFVVIGSAGVALLHPERFARAQVTDVDLLVRPEDLERWARTLENMGASVTSWGEPFERARREQNLRGRFYIRGTFCSGLQLDLTYESSTLEVEQLLPNARWVDEIPVCPVEDLWFSKALRDPERALRFAREHGVEIPARALERVYAALRNRPEERGNE
jgi:hypothetical protein